MLKSSGESCNGDSGELSLTTGPAFNGAGGDITVAVGKGDAVSGGNLYLLAGDSTNSSGTGGDVTVDAGTASGGTAGNVYIGPSASTINIGDPNGTSDINLYGNLEVDQLTIGTGGTAITKHISVVSAAYDPASLATGSQLSLDVTLPGAVVGDIVVAAFSQPLQGMMITANVKAPDTVQVIIINPGSNAVVDLAEGTFRISIWQY